PAAAGGQLRVRVACAAARALPVREAGGRGSPPRGVLLGPEVHRGQLAPDAADAPRPQVDGHGLRLQLQTAAEAAGPAAAADRLQGAGLLAAAARPNGPVILHVVTAIAIGLVILWVGIFLLRAASGGERVPERQEVA